MESHLLGQAKVPIFIWHSPIWGTNEGNLNSSQFWHQTWNYTKVAKLLAHFVALLNTTLIAMDKVQGAAQQKLGMWW